MARQLYLDSAKAAHFAVLREAARRTVRKASTTTSLEVLSTRYAWASRILGVTSSSCATMGPPLPSASTYTLPKDSRTAMCRNTFALQVSSKLRGWLYDRMKDPPASTRLGFADR
jgi:hypothetical protein